MGRLTLVLLFSVAGCAPSLGRPVATADGVVCMDGDRRTEGVAVCEAVVRDCAVLRPDIAGCPDGSTGFCAVVPVIDHDLCVSYLEACPPTSRCEVPFDPTNGELGDLVIIY